MIASFLMMSFFANAQLGGILKRIKDKAGSTTQDKTDKEVSSAVNKGIDNLLGRKKKKDAKTTGGADSAEDGEDVGVQTIQKRGLKSYSRFDFVPGATIQYAEDFTKDAIGEMPLGWTTKGKGEVMELDGVPGKWLRGFKESQLTSINKHELGENYTVEFDLIYYFGSKDATYVMPDLSIRLMNNFTVDYANASGNVSERSGENSFTFIVHPNVTSSAWVETYGKGPTFRSDKMQIASFSQNYNKIQHYSIQVQKNRLRVWIDENKIFDLPGAVNTAKKMARISFGLGHTSFKDDVVGFYVSNIRFANGAADTRHKLIDEGKFSTTGILFALNSAEIQPASYGVLKEIAGVLKENPAVKIKIVGHTSSDGKKEANLELSKNRAASVKQALEKEFAIDGSRLETDGKGDTQPMSSNTTSEGRIQNRRVEFIKL